jgi:hypothetical protein
MRRVSGRRSPPWRGKLAATTCETPHPAFGHLLPWEKAVIALGTGAAFVIVPVAFYPILKEKT